MSSVAAFFPWFRPGLLRFQVSAGDPLGAFQEPGITQRASGARGAFKAGFRFGRIFIPQVTRPIANEHCRRLANTDSSVTHGRRTCAVGEARERRTGVSQFRCEQVYITCKLRKNEHLKSNARPALEKTLADLKLDYLDLYLLMISPGSGRWTTATATFPAMPSAPKAARTAISWTTEPKANQRLPVANQM